MKKITLLLIILGLLIGFTPFSHAGNSERLDYIKQEMIMRGYLTPVELEEVLTWHGSSASENIKAVDIWILAVKNDLLPFEPMFFIAIKDENFKKAELIRKTWIYYLTKMIERINLINSRGGLQGKEFPKNVEIKIYHQLEKLSIIGLTDSMLITLRKELSAAILVKDWDSAQKIQNIITARVNEIRHSQPQIISRQSDGTTVIVQQPSKQHVQVEHIPRYGATDVARAFSLLSGQGGSLTDKEAGALKLFDILMKR